MAERVEAFSQTVNRLSGQQIELCYHCHTCTAGCPVSADMEFGPDRMIRLVELGDVRRALSTPDIWLCATCETCSARCPNQIDVARVMDTLRHLALVRGVASPALRVTLFHRLYMDVVRLLGRSHEAVLLGAYKLLSLDLTSDLAAGLALVLRGKIPLVPWPIKGTDRVQRVFAAAAEADRRQVV